MELEDINIVRATKANISLVVGDEITAGKDNKADVLYIDYPNEMIAISKNGDTGTLTFAEIECGNFKKVVR